MEPNPANGTPPAKATLTVDGRPLSCRPDTSVAVALWEADLRQLSHSHKYGRPRGLGCARGHCTNCLMRVDGVPNVRTCETPVRDGMVVTSQDTGTFYGAPMQKLVGLGSQWIPVGFYYKWFTRPATLSRFFLERIRPMTGVGRLPDREPPQRALPAAAAVTDRAPADLGRFDHIVVGAGPSGLQAAVASTGTTLLIDDTAEPGGQRRAALAELAGDGAGILARFPILAAAHARLEAGRAALAAAAHVRFLGGAKAIAGYQPGGVLIRRGDAVMTAHGDHFVWAAGALDTIGLFPGNDIPGLFGPRALYRLLTRDGMAVAGRHALLIGGGLDLWLSAALLHQRGALVNLVVTEGGFQSEVAAAVDLRWALNTGLKLDEMRSTGPLRVQAIFSPRLSAPGPRGSHMRLEADFVVACGPGKPAYDVAYQLGADLALVPARGGYVPRGCDTDPGDTFTATLPGGIGLTCTGEALGLLPLDQVTR